MVMKAKPSGEHGGADASDYVIAAIDNPWDAAQAEEALREARFDDEAIVVLGGWRVAAKDRIRVRRSMAHRFGELLAAQGSDALQEHLLKQMRQGHAVLAVYAPDPEQFERAIGVLEQYDAHAV
jgi:hypothetical protein